MTRFRDSLGIVTNIGVVIGLVLVGYEVHQTNISLDREFDAYLTEMGGHRFEAEQNFNDRIVGSAEVADIWIRGNAASSLSSVEQERYRLMATELIVIRRFTFDAWSRVREWEPDWVLTNYVAHDIARPGLRAEYARYIGDHSENGFARRVEAMLAEGPVPDGGD